MPQRIDIPGQGIVEFPDGMSDADITKVIQANSRPDASLMDRSQALASGVNSGLGTVLPGLPVDTVLNVGDLAKAGAGLAYHVFNQDTAVPDWATPTDRSKAVGSSEWIQNNLRKAGAANFIDPNRPDDTPSRYLHSAGLVAGTSLAGPQQGLKETAKQAMIAALSGGAGQAAVESGNPEYAVHAALLAPGAARTMATAGKALAGPLKSAANMVTPGGAERLLNQKQNEMLGPNALPVKTALENAQEIVPGSIPTAGEAVAGLPGGSPIIAHQKQVAQLPGGPSAAYGQRFDEQQAARQAALAPLGESPDFANPSVPSLRAAELLRDANAKVNYGKVLDDRIPIEAPEDVLAAKINAKQLSKASALQDMGRFMTEASQQENLANGGTIGMPPNPVTGTPRLGGTGNVSPSAYPVAGYPRIPGRYTENAQRVPEFEQGAKDANAIANQRQIEKDFMGRQLDALLQEMGTENPKLTGLLSRPSMRGALQEAMTGAQESGRYFPQQPGEPFSVSNLQRMKQALDDLIKDPATFGLKGTQVQEIGNTRDAFVNWLSNRSPFWARARNAYTEDSQPINQMQIGQYLQDKLTSAKGGEQYGAFAQALRDAPGTIKRSTGQPRYDELSEVMSPDQMNAINSVKGDLSRRQDYLTPTQRTNLGDTMGQGIELPHMLSKPLVMANYLLKLLGHDVEGKMNRIAADRYLNPKELAKFIKTPLGTKAPNDQDRLIELLKQNPGALGVQGMTQQ